jgi:glyceraldehyde 3-phosphate dehydrogenase
MPELAGRVDGLSLRIPVHGGSLVDLVARLDSDVTDSEVNAAFKHHADGPLERVLSYTEDPVVSSDIIGSPASCTFDAGLTAARRDYVTIVGWYDNEWGYCHRLAGLARLAAPQAS